MWDIIKMPRVLDTAIQELDNTKNDIVDKGRELLTFFGCLFPQDPAYLGLVVSEPS